MFALPSRVSSWIAAVKTQLVRFRYVLGDLYILTRQWLGSSQVQVCHILHGGYSLPSNKAAARSEKGGGYAGGTSNFSRWISCNLPGVLLISDRLEASSVKGLTRDWDWWRLDETKLFPTLSSTYDTISVRVPWPIRCNQTANIRNCKFIFLWMQLAR